MDQIFILKNLFKATVLSLWWNNVWPSTLSGGVGMYLFINLLNDLTIHHHSEEVPKFCQVKRIWGFESFVSGKISFLRIS